MELHGVRDFRPVQFTGFKRQVDEDVKVQVGPRVLDRRYGQNAFTLGHRGPVATENAVV